MATKLTGTLKREINIDGKPHTVHLTPEGLTITVKRGRIGRAHSWKDLAVTGTTVHVVSAPAASTP